MQILEPPATPQRRPSPIENQPTPAPVFSIVGPVYNEEALLEEFCLRTTEVLESLGEPFELVLVNDGSRDRSPEILRRLKERDDRLKEIKFFRNFRMEAALAPRVQHARGQAIIVMDTDLQDPPEVLPQLIAKWHEGYQLIYAQRAERAGETWFKKFTALAFYRLITSITSVKIPVDTGEFRLMDRKVVDAI